MLVKIMVIVFCIIFAIMGKFMLKNWINPVSIFSGIWAMLFLLSSLALYSLYGAEEGTYILMFMGVVSFFISFLLVYVVRKNTKIYFTIAGHRLSSEKEWRIRYNLCYIVGLVCLLFFLYQFLQIISVYISGGNLATIRSILQNSSTANRVGGSIVNAFRILVILPVSIALIPITAIDFWYGRRDKKLLILCLSIIMLRVFTEGGRIAIVYFALHIFVGFVFYVKKIKDKKMVERLRSIRKNKKLLIAIVCFIFLLIIWTTISRTGNNLKRITYYYFSMQPYMFETWAKKVDEANIIGYGEGSLNGFLFPLFYIIKHLFRVDFPEHWESIYRMILRTDDEWQVISSSLYRANAYVSCFWYFYLDGGKIGVVLMSAIYGFFGGNIYMSAEKYNNPKTVCIYSFFLQCVIMSFSGFSFSSIYYALAFLFIFVFAFKKTKLVVDDKREGGTNAK